jgi:hypothetical protein
MVKVHDPAIHFLPISVPFVNFPQFPAVFDPGLVERFWFDPVELASSPFTGEPTGCHAPVTACRFGVGMSLRPPIPAQPATPP